MTMAATGDSFITRRFPAGDETHRELAQWFGGFDIRFTNLEVTLPGPESCPAAQSGGTWAAADPSVLDDLRKYGFNALAWANNHSLDYSYGGLEETERQLDRFDWVHAGAGSNLGEAGAIRYMELPAGRAALIAATSTFHESWRAGEQRGDMAGRPGVNPLRFSTTYRISEQQLAELRAIASETGINDYQEMLVKEGFFSRDPDDGITFGGHRFVASDVSGAATQPHLGDMARILGAIGNARRQADYVIVSIHSHEIKDGRKDAPADFLREFARRCIDEGAHAVIGHGPHVIRGVELYRGKPILYSLGNFIFQNDSVDRLPADFYEKYGLGPEHRTADALDARSAGDTRGLGASPDVWSSVVAGLEFEGGDLVQMRFRPITLGYGEPRYRRGWPRLTGDGSVLLKLQSLSRELGTELAIEGTQAIWKRSNGNG
ncbi:CapA family protein [Paenibacillus ginsengarvi]|uniref:CapA family protein n=1 Tax=Paenibacillus ginsengarvi TaxID=400777 RepID=A0A3B0CBG0_9BACL|nr:CapA family protein [Paenibacillus ginsengarvi]RKN82061.1 CapA family protein [Paenibacillus ginsengarvi]